MPHLVLDSVEGLPENERLGDLLETLATTLGSYQTIDPRAVKAYAQIRTLFRTGAGAPPGFVHLEVAVLAGRSVEMRRAMAHGLYNKVKEFFHESLKAGRIGITLEVREMDPETYRK
jgi:5-carboxymethyl-2-hydroxymuconate isomerase